MAIDSNRLRQSIDANRFDMFRLWNLTLFDPHLPLGEPKLPTQYAQEIIVLRSPGLQYKMIHDLVHSIAASRFTEVDRPKTYFTMSLTFGMATKTAWQMDVAEELNICHFNGKFYRIDGRLRTFLQTVSLQYCFMISGKGWQN